MEERNKVEAVLFATGRFMDVEEIARACGIGSVGYVRELLEKLKRDYEERGAGLVIVQDGEKWKLNIRKEYGEIATRLIGSGEFDNPTTKTLAIIAYKQPVLQSEIIKIRGNKAYDHIKVLLERELISSEKHGRTRLLKLTAKFYDYFDTAEEKVKEMFKSVSEKLAKREDVREDSGEDVGGAVESEVDDSGREEVEGGMAKET